MQTVDAILFWANAMPARPAIIQPHGVQSYRMLADAIMAAASHFARSELDAAKPVAVAIEDPARMLVAILALLRAGFSVVPIHKGLLEHVPLTGADTLVSEHGGLVWTGHTTVLFNDAWMSAHARPRETGASAQPAARDGDMIFFTSGSTGRPKTSVHTPQARLQRILRSRMVAFADFERGLVIPSLSSSFGFHRVSDILFSGKTACFAPFGEPTLLLANIYNIEFMNLSVQQALALAEIQEKRAPVRLPALKALRIGGGKISQQGIERIKLNLCRNIILTYASTEAGTIAMGRHDMIAHIADAAGFVMPDVKVEIVDAAGAALPIGSEGFVRVQSPLSGAAAMRASEADREAHWLYPGDIGRLTHNGVLCIAGRQEDVLNRGGVKLATTDLEEFLLAAPGVRDAGACSVMGETGLAEIWVGVVLVNGFDAGDFQRHIESDQTFSGNIDKMFVVEAIPRGENRKLQREQLRIMLKSILEEE
jgi:acyl-coenzyme A synthetase/AMP-(fatty) acid ligase